MNYKIAQFILTPPQRSQSTLEIYIAQPDANKEALAGKLFALIEIESNKAENLKIINFLINTLNHNYYQNEKMILRERVNTVKIEHIFESALAKTNKKLAEFLQTEKIRLNAALLNITIGVIYNDSLHFANLGKNKALLIYKGKTEETAKYKLADITEKTENQDARKPLNMSKLFSNVVSGAVPRGGYFIFANETLSEYLSAKQLINILTTLPPAGAAEQIKNTLEKINAYVPFLGIIIKNTAGLEMPEIKLKEQPPVSTEASITNLITTEEKTEKLLTPSGVVNLKKWTSLAGVFAGRFKAKSTRQADLLALSLKDKIFTKRKTSWLSLSRLAACLKNTFNYLARATVYLFKIITDKQALLSFFNSLVLKTKNFFISLKNGVTNAYLWYKNLGGMNKILLSAFIACLIILLANLSWQSIQNKKTDNLMAVSGLISTIEQKENQIDASLLYSNEEGAKKILAEVKELLKQLPQKTQEQKDRYSELAAKYQVQLEKISRVIRANPTELANFINLNHSAQPANIIMANGKIFAADAAQKAVYAVDLTSKLATAIKINDQTINRLDFPTLDKNNNIYYLAGNKFMILETKTDKITNLGLDYGDTEKIIDVKQYNNRFYLTDGSSGQINRLAKNADRLTNATAWLNKTEDLSAVVGSEIDGNIYLVKKDGQISKYAKGGKQDFIISTVEPAVSRASKMAISPEKDYLYIFEPAAKRLIVYDKAGNFLAQYVNDDFNALKDFQVDEKNKKIYFLNGAAVYWIEASHFK